MSKITDETESLAIQSERARYVLQLAGEETEEIMRTYKDTPRLEILFTLIDIAFDFTIDVQNRLNKMTEYIFENERKQK